MIPVSPLQLKAHAFTSMVLRAMPDGSFKNEPTLKPTTGFEPDPEQPNHWRAFLRIQIGSARPERPFVYELDVSVQGLVAMDPGFPEEKREMVARANGLGMLYSSVRELVTTITGRFAHGALNLPALNFSEVSATAEESAVVRPEPRKPRPKT